MSDDLPSDETIRHMDPDQLQHQADVLTENIRVVKNKIADAKAAAATAAAAAATTGVGAASAIDNAEDIPGLERAQRMNEDTLARVKAKQRKLQELGGAPDRPPDRGGGEEDSSDSGSKRASPSGPTPEPEPYDTSVASGKTEMSGKQTTPGVLKERTKAAEEAESRARQASIDAAHSRTFGARFQRFMAATIALLRQLWQYISVKADPYWQRFKHGVRNEFREAFPSNEAEARGELPKFKYVPPHERKRSQGGQRPDGDKSEADG